MHTSLDKLPPVYLADPVNWEHPLNVGRKLWWLTLPGLSGGRQWLDLCALNPSTLTNMTAGNGWQATNRTGGFGEIRLDTFSGGYIAGPTDVAFNGNGGFTAAAWAYTTSTFTGGIMDKGRSSAWGCYFEAGAGKIKFNLANTEIVAAAARALLTWYRVLITYDNNIQSLYLNGLLSASTTRGALSLTGSTAISMGRLNDGSYLAGGVDGFSYWNRPFGAFDAAADYQSEITGNPRTLNRIQLMPGKFAQSPAGMSTLLLIAEDEEDDD
jgi:hypothetical protein